MQWFSVLWHHRRNLVREWIDLGGLPDISMVLDDQRPKPELLQTLINNANSLWQSLCIAWLNDTSGVFTANGTTKIYLCIYSVDSIKRIRMRVCACLAMRVCTCLAMRTEASAYIHVSSQPVPSELRHLLVQNLYTLSWPRP